VLRLGVGGLALPVLGCRDEAVFGKDVSGLLPDLAFTMTRADDGRTVTEKDYRGQVSALFFGFTSCPDVCPLTLANLSLVADGLGARAGDLSVLFVTVDPERDTPEALARYIGSFTPRADGLRGTPDQLARLARRFKVTYKIADHAPGAEDYGVTHGMSVYLFDRTGAARQLWPGFSAATADIDAATRSVARLIAA
jgi:protein SCO1/2